MQIIIGFLVLLLLVTVILLVWSFVETAGGRRYDFLFYEKDRCGKPGVAVQRRYRGLGHVIYRLWDTLRYSYPLVRVYVFRSLAPGFREKIMLVTARTNNCRH
ncbi:hypothetical protein [Desulfosudis oleivorans]|uniref:Uncharacterized protein n=1 Tax=Desulfosudis oleivorans (strain DSM 6200 / JCM 39069 / Hxd3) TaxID=96561 RepID=A8ZSD1_DESOH|nr:hypothetical protein [Desulfosudis oleivorans]ABW67668.1 hypothetical protein Dole_1864 [Desulfosudis oleivorans Hxd3]